MNKKRLVSGFFVLLFLSCAAYASAADVQELERRINVLSDELDGLKRGGAEVGHKEAERVTLHGYGELHYNRPTDGRTTEFDNHRFVLGAHARLTDWIFLNAEIDFEHAAQELEFEFSHLDFMLDPKYNFRAGVMLMPVGFLNEYHEPPLFWSVERPELQSKVIPTTWSGAGAGFFGTPVEGLNYRLYVVNSVQSVRKNGFSEGDGTGAGGASGRFRESDGIRQGRLQINKAIGEDVAVVGRLEYSKLYPGLQLGFSFYTGDTTHELISQGGRTTLVEGDVKYRWQWFEANSTIVNIDVGDAAALNAFNATQTTASSGTGTVPDRIFGWNIQAGVHLPQLLKMNSTHDFVPFVLYEQFDLHKSVPAGFTRNPLRDTEVFTVGVSYMPIPSVALKLDYQDFEFGNNTSQDQINMGVAYMY
ncbi:MAG: hypothetical protein HY579_07175 [Nitrospinae bacterium]|nr:hypothetical protein [Nitrospinota bacterium]